MSILDFFVNVFVYVFVIIFFFLELLKIFKAFDENGDGKVSKHELVRASKKMGVNNTLKDIEKVLRTMHTDRKH